MEQATVPQVGRVGYWGLPLLMISLANLVSAFTSFLLPLYLDAELHFSGWQIGAVFGAFNITAIVGALPSGIGNDRRRSRVLVSAALVLVALAALALSSATHFAAFTAGFVIFGVGYYLFRISLDALVYRTNRAGAEGWRLALYHTFRMGSFGVGTLLISLLLDRIGFPLALRALALCSLLMLPLAWMLPATQTSHHELVVYRADLRRREVLLYLAWMFIFASHWGAEQTSYALFLLNNLGLSTAGVGRYMFGEFVGVCLLLPLLGWRADRGLSMRRVMLLGLLASGIGHIGMTWPSYWISFAFRFLHGLGDTAVFLLIALGVARLFSLERIGGHSGLVTFVTLLGSFVGALVYGPLGAAAGWNVSLIVSGATTLLLIPLFLRARRRAEA